MHRQVFYQYERTFGEIFFQHKRTQAKRSYISIPFLLAMEVFFNMMNRVATSPKFEYHARCKSLGISHVIFANDLFLLSTATISSVSGLSGLQHDASKSGVFIASADAAIAT